MTCSAGESDKKVKNVFTDGVTFDRGVKKKSGFLGRERKTLSVV